MVSSCSRIFPCGDRISPKSFTQPSHCVEISLFQSLRHPDQLISVAMMAIKPPSTLIGGEHGQRDMAAAMLPGPALGIGYQRTAHAFAIVFVCDDQIGNMAVEHAGKEILLRLQVQEPEALAVVILRHEQMRGSRQLAKMAGDFGANAGESLFGLAPGRQVESDEALRKSQNEIVIVRVSQANMDAAFGLGGGHGEDMTGVNLLGHILRQIRRRAGPSRSLHRTRPYASASRHHPNWASVMLIRLSMPLRIDCAWVWVRGRIRAKKKRAVSRLASLNCAVRVEPSAAATLRAQK